MKLARFLTLADALTKPVEKHRRTAVVGRTLGYLTLAAPAFQHGKFSISIAQNFILMAPD